MTTPPRTERRSVAREDPIRAAHHDAIFAFARACELHDGDTGEHVLRIRGIVELVAIELGFDPVDAEDLGYDAMLHDVGKLTIPAEILRKPDGLTAEERRTIESHTALGETLLGDRPSMRRAARIARSHHERYDGNGYPDGMRGEAIPLEARITAVADVLDALLAPRSYKAAWERPTALERVYEVSGSQLDPNVVDTLRRCEQAGSLAAVVRRADGPSH